MHITSRIPAFDNDFVSRTWQFAEVLQKNGVQTYHTEKLQTDSYGKEFIIIQYLVRGKGADYIISYENYNPGSYLELETRLTFEEMVNSFRLLADFSYETPVQALALNADGFDFFVDLPDGGTRSPSYASYNANNGGLSSSWSSCYSKYMSQLQHAGEDWFRSVGTPVYAVANGRVIYTHPQASYPGNVIIIEHTLGNGWTNPWGGNTIYSVYAHVNAEITQWSDVTKGERIATVMDYPSSGDHVHFEMRRYGDMSSILVCPSSGTSSWPGPGYTDAGIHPDTYGYTNPSAWVDGHRNGGGGSCDATSLPSGYTKCAEEGSGNWCNFSGLKTVYYGANSCFATEQKSSSVECVSGNFGGDPLPGVHKACYIQPDPQSCPTVSGLVRIFDGTNCGTPSVDVGLGLAKLEQSNYDFNDKAESIAIPSGWSARLFQNNNENLN